MIGDPSGKSTDRVQLDDRTVTYNAQRIESSLRTILNFDCGATSAVTVNNLEFYKGVSAIHFFRDIGMYVCNGGAGHAREPHSSIIATSD